MVEKQYTNNWFAERGGKTWDKVLHKRQIKSALEIGCYEGQASVYLLEHFPKMQLIVVDLFDAKAAEDWDGYVDDYEARFENNVSPFRDRVLKYKGKSFNALADAIQVNAKFDFIYVDGDHRALPAMQDCVMAIELLEENGIMIIDDYGNIPWLHDAVDAFVKLLPKDKYKVKTTSDNEQMIVKRIK
jgi:predicted O-methyltransferase YrrM